MELRVRLSALLIVASVAWLAAQTITASLEGTVRDPSGGVIPKAQVKIVNTGTNATTVVETGADGRFVAPSLPPGAYAVAVEAAGFKKVDRTGIVLRVDQAVSLDLTLQVGAVSETVEVTGAAPLLESTTSSLGQVIENRSIVNLPLNQRNAYSLVFLSPGVIGNVDFQFNQMNISINGGRPGSNEFLADGIPSSPPLVNPIQGYSVFPSVDAVQEFKVETNNYSAEFGRSGGGIINLIYKSGANQLHGSLFEFVRNSKLDGNDFFSNQHGIPLGSFKRNQFGASASGPVVLPKLYNGHNKTFFLATYEGLRQRAADPLLTTVPTALQRAGDFSQTRNAAGALITMFDPATTTASGSGFVRQAFTSNVIPPSRIDPVAAAVTKYYPLPNSPGLPNTGASNFAVTGTAPTDTNQIDAKVDENINERNRFFVRYSHRKLDLNPSNQLPPENLIADGKVFQPQISNNAAFDYTWNARPTFLMDFRYGFGRTLLLFRSRADGFDPASIGLPAYIGANADRLTFPGFNPAGYLGLGNGFFRHNAFETHSFAWGNTKVLARHVLRFGFETRLLRVNNTEAANADGNFSFNRNFTQGPDPNRATATAGDAYASFLLGLGTGTMTKGFKGVSTQSHYHAWYVANDWKVSTRLTLNLGLRYEIDIPRTERYNRINVFDGFAPSPLAGPAGLPNLVGGLEFVGVDGRSRQQFPTDRRGWAPRFGFAYQATKNTVVRGGFGIFHAPSLRAAGGTVGNFGYRSDTQFISAPDGVTPVDYLRNPFPSGLVPIPGNTQGLLTGIGSSISASLRGDNTVPYTENWNFNVQRELPGGVLIDAAYVGNHALHLNQSGEGDYNLNQLAPAQLALGTRLQQQVKNPFFGLITSGPLVAPTIPMSFLVAPYPQFTTVFALYQTGASSVYHSFQLKVEKRLSSGLSLLLAFTAQKLIDDYSIISNVGRNVTMQNIYNRRAERSVSSNDVARRLVWSYVYEFPLGRGRKFGGAWNRLTDALLGGWQTNGIFATQTGQPLTITTQNTSGSGSSQLRPDNNGRSAALGGSVESRLNRYFDASVFTQPPPFTFGNTGRTLPDVRGPGVFNLDFSLFKNFHATERTALQFRAEAFNLLNKPQFGFPNQNLSTAQFGVISSQANSPRQIQFGLKLLF